MELIKMVIKNNNNIKYRCPYCNRDYCSYEEADECAKDCVFLEYEKPYEVTAKASYICKYCNKQHKTMYDAEYCENKHIEYDDFFYEEFVRNEKMQRLKNAANHPDQVKLINYI